MDLRELSDADLDDLQGDVLNEIHRRLSLRDAERRAAELEADMRKEMDIIAGDFIRARDFNAGTEDAEWVKPTGMHDAYPEGKIVRDKGERWLSLIPNNDHEPAEGKAWTKLPVD